MAGVWEELSGRRERIEAALRESLERHGNDVPQPLADAMAYSLLAPGKRLRPLMTVLACEAAGGPLESALPAACALEMIHTYSLIHDDLPAMDDDALRRGRPTCHIQFGEALAILAGDALLTLAFQVVAEGCGPRTAAVSCAELARGAGAAGMVAGQVLDLAAEGRIPTPTHDTNYARDCVAKLAGIHARKTGALFRSALRLGVFAAQAESATGVDPVIAAAADDYAVAFGLAFQITDDLLDVQSTTEKTGKGVGKDAARGKLTYPGLLGIEESRLRAAALGRQAVAAAERMGSPSLARLAMDVVERDR